MPKAIDITGQVFGRLTALVPTKERRNTFVVWKCHCRCGNTAFVSSYCLRQGKTRSCGCLHRELMVQIGENSKTHGLAEHPLYHSWMGALRRCHGPKNPRHKNWGGRGIKVWEPWRDAANLESFIAHCETIDGWNPEILKLGPGALGLSIDRIINNSHYQPFN